MPPKMRQGQMSEAPILVNRLKTTNSQNETLYSCSRKCYNTLWYDFKHVKRSMAQIWKNRKRKTRVDRCIAEICETYQPNPLLSVGCNLISMHLMGLKIQNYAGLKIRWQPFPRSPGPLLPPPSPFSPGPFLLGPSKPRKNETNLSRFDDVVWSKEAPDGADQSVLSS